MGLRRHPRGIAHPTRVDEPWRSTPGARPRAGREYPPWPVVGVRPQPGRDPGGGPVPTLGGEP